MKRLLFLFLFPLYTIAQAPKGFDNVKDLALFNKLLSEFSKKTNTLSVDFVQTKNLKMLKNKVIQNGKMNYAKENKVRIDYLSPKKSSIIINNGKSFLIENGKTTNVTNNMAFKRINQLILSCLKGDIANSKEFKASYYENNNQYFLILTPVAKAMQGYISTIHLLFDKNNMTLQRMQLNEPNSDFTLFEFSNKKINEAVDTKIFTVN